MNGIFRYSFLFIVLCIGMSFQTNNGKVNSVKAFSFPVCV